MVTFIVKSDMYTSVYFLGSCLCIFTKSLWQHCSPYLNVFVLYTDNIYGTVLNLSVIKLILGFSKFLEKSREKVVHYIFKK